MVESTLTLKFRGVEADLLNRMVETGLFKSNRGWYIGRMGSNTIHILIMGTVWVVGAFIALIGLVI